MAEAGGGVDVEAIVAGIARSRKYRDICEDTIRDLVLGELGPHQPVERAVRLSRKKLHHVVASYLGDPDYREAADTLQAAFESEAPGAVREACTRIMAAHVSTRERLATLEPFYSRLFAVTGLPGSILDIACGLNPLSFPWMGLPSSTRYVAYDIQRPRVAFLNHYFSLQGLAPLARVQDVLVHFPEEEADVALIFKEVHRFEQRRRGCTLPLLDALRVRTLAVSFPSRSLSGRWDLAGRHRRLFQEIVSARPWRLTELEFENELLFCVEKGGT